ncbi:antibiotic biosynthesis monooxygenase [Dysgonomonas sp. Marseille-P4677]|uniref:putative quinol monooxygenase n=1 Tax=Dysgonomonas sp. Marseille-P4677 TaxID=2364790 RepID=UPI001913ECD6|nr:putative quinol monooxygenase [Dysgonomonas sp. Marseille-P4677]MBK5722957.1 antibiotic biosynthesis monooxygenase [Dysgonomonas sp. Marseille-P4677]
MKKIIFITLFGLLCITSCNKKSEVAQEDAIVVKTGMDDERTGDELKIVAIITVKPEAINDILPIFQAVVQSSQEEEGCISYNLHQDIANPTKFIMLEEWESQDAINFHNNTDHFKIFKEASKDLIEKSEVSILKLVY